MSMSGIDVDADTVQSYNKMKIKKANEPHKELLVMKITSDNKVTELVDESKLECDNDGLRDFLSQHTNEAYYIVHDFQTRNKQHKLVGICWAPDTAKLKEKMIYASTYEGIKSKFDGVKWMPTVMKDAEDYDDKDINAL